MNTKTAVKTFTLFALLVLLVVISIVWKSVYQSYPGVNKGELVISDESFYGDKLLLSGEWEFYFGELLNSQEFDAKTQKNYYTLPDFWQRDWNDTSVDINGYGSYRIQVFFETPKDTVTLHIPWVFGAYEVFADGKSILRCGEVGVTPEAEKPDVRARTVVIPLENKDSLELIIQVSGQISGISGLARPLALGPNDSVLAYTASRIVPDAFFVGCFFIFAFYHLALFLTRRKDKATLYFALLCFAAVLYQGTFTYGLLYSFLPEGSGLLAYDFYIISHQWMIGFFALFSYALFGTRYGMGKKLLLLQVACCVLISILECFHVYKFSWLIFYLSNANLLVCVVLVVRVFYLSCRKKEKLRFLYGYGALYLLLASVAALLVDFGFFRSDVMFGSATFAIFVFIEAIILARIHTNISNENERMRLNMESLVEIRTAELAEANKQLRLMEQTRSDLLSGISHDLRTPITAVKGYLELIESEAKNGSTQVEYAHNAKARTEQLEKLISDLFFLTKLSEKSLPVHLESVDVSEVLLSFYHNCLPTTEKKGIRLILHDVSFDAVVQADRSFLNRILDNLIENALYHARSKVEIECTVNEGFVLIRVADDGEGISAEDLPCIFDRFYKKRKDGTGLGLCIVKKLVEALNGEVFAKSPPDGETEFFVRLKTETGKDS